MLSCLLVAVSDGLRISSSDRLRDDCSVPNKMIPAVHHLHSKQAWERANQVFQFNLTQKSLLVDAPKLFCATWVKPTEDGPLESWVSEIHRMHEGCDGGGVFSNFESLEMGITKTVDGPGGKNAHSMIGFLSIYRHLANDALAKKYDWFMILESDHFIQPLLWKQAFATETASDTRRMPNGAVLVKLENVFAVNQAMLQEMKKQEATLGKVVETGCPAWAPWTQCTDCNNHGNCQADVSTPLIPATMKEGTATFYDAGNHGNTFLYFSELLRQPCASLYIEMQNTCAQSLRTVTGHCENWNNPEYQVDWIQQVASKSHQSASLVKAQEAQAYTLEDRYTRTQDIVKKTLEDVAMGKIELTPRQEEALSMMLY